MARKKLIIQLFPSYAIILLFAVVAVAFTAFTIISEQYWDEKVSDLESRAELLLDQAQQGLQSKNYTAIDSLFDRIGKRAKTRLTLILTDGKVIADSEKDPQLMDNHKDRPEIITALEGKIGSSRRYSFTTKMDQLYVAVPVYSAGRLYGVFRVSVPVPFIDSALEAIRDRLVLVVIILGMLMTFVAYFVSRRIARPVELITRGVEQFAHGHLDYRLKEPNSTELGRLTDALNEMARQLSEKIATISAQKNERQAILESMVEGVLAVDMNDRLLNLNKAAADFFNLDEQESIGKPVQELIRNAEMHTLISKTLHADQPVESEIIVRNEQEYFLQLHGSTLRGAGNSVIGALIVLNNVTRLRRLENIRKDFVANVSHEIRTPLTSIKGFAETLLDDEYGDPEEVKQFIQIIARQANRLNAIIEDLLTLARLEQSEDRSAVEFKNSSITDLLNNSLELCRPAAQQKQITVKVESNESLQAPINAALLEQALVNLIDNAIKYSPDSSVITLSATREQNDVLIRVSDQGVGIEQQHLSRLFERFYRVDKARSREVGGTGLGLAIVKHIAQVHNGTVSVESTPGKGSTFTIRISAIPAAAEQSDN